MRASSIFGGTDEGYEFNHGLESATAVFGIPDAGAPAGPVAFIVFPPRGRGCGLKDTLL